MARPRTVSAGLPDRIYLNKTIYYYRTKTLRHVPLGDDVELARALGQWLFDQEHTAPRPLPSTIAADILRKAREGARTRHLEFDLRVGHVERLLRRAGGRCEITRIQFTLDKPPGARFAPWSPSIDRIDNAKGYEFENCRLVCAYTNIAMSDLGAVGLIQLSLALNVGRFWKVIGLLERGSVFGNDDKTLKDNE